MSEEIKEETDELKECQQLKDEYLAGWQRAKADFLNYKKEESERIEQVLQYRQEEMLLDILMVLDNFELACRTMSEDLKKDPHVEGLLKVKIQLESFLKAQGVEEINTAGIKFDTKFCEVVEAVEESGAESGLVLEETQKGYTRHGKVLRPAKVRVAA
ncbi:MAG: nucleotide exchange factor GrpE [bacterium]